METIFMNTESSKTNESNKFIYQFIDKLNLQNPNYKYIWLVNLTLIWVGFLGVRFEEWRR